ncbi:MAG: 2Fe-2S iron-sulfur cluster binding domain-containing protein [Pyrinomonadaceae bacterium]|nr:2Fe-2S iron-sulfur cluster binding domain-containing protein [Pyrinomonadaceae bacterium]
MTEFLLNDETVETGLPAGLTVLDFVRYKRNLKGTKIGCREGDCGACTVLVGEPTADGIRYRSMTSCLMPLANAAGKHIVTVEGINPKNGELTPVQESLVDHGGTQCGFCTVGFVMSLTGFCLDDTEKDQAMSVSAVDGNICRCTGYKSIERAAAEIAKRLSGRDFRKNLESAVKAGVVPKYFNGIESRLREIKPEITDKTTGAVVGGGTDLYVQKPEEMVSEEATHVLYSQQLRGIEEIGGRVEIGASATVTDLLESQLMKDVFPDLFFHLKLVSSTPIRNMATLAGNFVNASPIGDMTVWFLALDAKVVFDSGRSLPLRKFYRGYKELEKDALESITRISFVKPGKGFRFNFEKVCKRQYLDIATVNTAISFEEQDGALSKVHVSAGGVAPIPLYLSKTSEYLDGKTISAATIRASAEVIDSEISPISDVRGSADYKRLLLRQLFKAHFIEVI